jgi:hypothetical protein
LLERRQEAVELGSENVTPSLDRNHPIPVYLSIASWDPENEHIEAFIVRQMNEQFEFPSGRPEFGTCFADTLMKQGCLVPVLDGLDELPAELLTSAIEGSRGVHGLLSVLSCSRAVSLSTNRLWRMTGCSCRGPRWSRLNR